MLRRFLVVVWVDPVPAVDRRVMTGRMSVVLAMDFLSSVCCCSGVAWGAGYTRISPLATSRGDDRIDAVLVDGFYAAWRQCEGDAPAERRHEITFALQVRFEAAADFPM